MWIGLTLKRCVAFMDTTEECSVRECPQQLKMGAFAARNPPHAANFGDNEHPSRQISSLPAQQRQQQTSAW
jgi:hypothetical protein